ncbi:MAG: 2-oxoglutarate dehydrogenase, E2 component, dihydrolipoamide succinyltransferase [Propioniciclava sp.]
MPTNVPLPALGESVTEGTISRWLKNVGDTVEADEALVEVSTDKVDTEIPSPAGGIVLEILVAEDETAEVGATLAVIGDASEVSDAPAAVPPAPEPAADAPAASAPAPAASAAATAAGTEVTLPALGESVTEGTISRWLKSVGETVEADEALVEVSTDKVDTEIPSPAAGTLLEIRVPEDETAEVGAVLAIIGDEAAAPAPEVPAQPAAPASPEPAVPTPTPSAPAAASATPTRPAPGTPAPRRATSSADVGYVTPLVRKLAAQHEVDLTTLAGTGVGGRIRKQDVLAAAEAAKQPAAPATPAPAPTEAPAAVEPDPRRGTTEKISRLRATIAKRMTESLQVAAQLTATVEVDLTAISRIRAAAKDEFKAREGASLSYLPFITLAAVEALKQFPMVNAQIDTEAGTVTYAAAEHVGIAVDTPKGLLVPVIKDAGDLNVSGLARKIADLAARTRTNKVTPDELTGGTFTITNYGSAGTLFDTPIINQPQVAILGTGALVKRPVVIKDARLGEVVAVRDMMYLSMTYDHRLVDGADAARFLSVVKARLEEGAFGAEFGL